MKTSFISTQAMSQSTRHQIIRMQAELIKAEKEVVTQRAADTGLHLGARTGQAVTVERDIVRFQGIIDSNNMAAVRLSATQDGLKAMSTLAGNFLSTLTAASAGSVEPNIVRSEALGLISSMTSVLNESLNGEYLFAGINTDVRPINDFSAPGSPARAAIETAFQTRFGIGINDPAAVDIDGAAIEDFIRNDLQPAFMNNDWDEHWSNATNETIVSRLTLNDTGPTSVSANNDGIKHLAFAAAIVDVLFDSAISDGARKAVAQNAAATMGQATSGLAQLQGQTGVIEQRVKAANDRISMQIDVFKGSLTDLVGIDPYEASSRISTLLSQIETAYTLTSRIRQLSLTRYLP